MNTKETNNYVLINQLFNNWNDKIQKHINYIIEKLFLTINNFNIDVIEKSENWKISCSDINKKIEQFKWTKLEKTVINSKKNLIWKTLRLNQILTLKLFNTNKSKNLKLNFKETLKYIENEFNKICIIKKDILIDKKLLNLLIKKFPKEEEYIKKYFNIELI